MKPKWRPSSRTAASDSDGEGEGGDWLWPAEGDGERGDTTAGDDGGPVVDVAAGVPFVHPARTITPSSDPALHPMALMGRSVSRRDAPFKGAYRPPSHLERVSRVSDLRRRLSLLARLDSNQD